MMEILDFDAEMRQASGPRPIRNWASHDSMLNKRSECKTSDSHFVPLCSLKPT